MANTHRFNWQVTLCLVALATGFHTARGASSLTKNDPYPVFTSLDSSFLQIQEKIEGYHPEFAECKENTFGLSLSVFGQNADRGRTLSGKKCLPEVINSPCDICNSPANTTNSCTGTPERSGVAVALGDITGRANMIALLLGDTPAGQELGPTLEAARTALLALVPDLTTLIDPTQRLGNFSFPLKYRKRGFRFDASLYIAAGFGLNVRGGFASICQTPCPPIDLTCQAENTCPNCTTNCPTLFVDTDAKFKELQETIIETLTGKLKEITNEQGLDICSFQENSFEELRFSAFWRHGYELNTKNEAWPHMFLTPFLQLTGSVSPSKTIDPSKVFAVPFGNNKHNAIALDAGLTMEFIDSIEIGAEIGATHFFEKTFCNYRVPNYECQRVLFPFISNVSIKPGHNWHFAAHIGTFHSLATSPPISNMWLLNIKRTDLSSAAQANAPPAAQLLVGLIRASSSQRFLKKYRHGRSNSPISALTTIYHPI